MAVTIKVGNIKYKDPSTGDYEGLNMVSDNTTAEQVAAIGSAAATQISAVNAAGSAQVTAVQNKGAETIASIPSDYTNLSNEVSALSSAFENGGYLIEQSDIIQGSYSGTGAVVSNPNRIRPAQFIPVTNGGTVHFVPGENVSAIFYGKFDANKSFLGDGPSWFSTDFTTNWDGYMVCVYKNASNTAITPADYDAVTLVMTKSEKEKYDQNRATEGLIKQNENVTWISGYYFNRNSGEISAEANYKYCTIDVSEFVGGTVKGTTSVAPNSQIGIGFTDGNNYFISGYTSTATGQWLFTYDVNIPQNAKYFYISCRIATESMFSYPVFSFDYVLQNIGNRIGKIEEKSADNTLALENAKHIKGGNSTPLVLMHFSDLHGQAQTMMRLVDKMANIGNVDGIICTGDIVRYKAEPIVSWWDESIMTCIGNHDSASFENNTYDWTALSMADRDAYYIAPFESNWGITHTSGTSYYYKDYATQKVRLIVMDAMLYNDNGAEATAQTAWLENLLADAISNNLHVLIAIHAPHGGSTAEDCSFSRYGQGTMPTLSDCNTPQTVIDAVATKISAGLKFIGYLCGHTHQDNVWDAENNGKQLMYCITCASVEEVQWVNSDQHRGFTLDAFNIVTVDTEHTLLKIVRGGGADIDDHMRTRKAICINYSTGEIVGEVL